MDKAVEEARANFDRAKEQLLQNFAKIPDDKLNWSPAPTARTPVEIVAHCAEALGNLTEMMNGHTFAPPTTPEADLGFRENEKNFTSREQALQAFNKGAQEFESFLDRLSPDQLDKPVTLPFGMGEAPMRQMITFPALHTLSHVPQLEYLQTCYGDRTWLM